MMKLARVFLPQIAYAATLMAATIPGPETALQIDPAQTKVEFSLPTTLHTVHGSFALKRGTIRFDPVTGKAAGELAVDAASGESGNGPRDRRMNGHILDSDQFPEIIFLPDHVEGKVALQGVSQVELHGMFRIHGSEHELTLRVEVEAADGVFTATIHFSIPYVKWGMKNPSTLFLRVSDKVDLTIHTVAHPLRQTSGLRCKTLHCFDSVTIRM